jgi:phosphate transport system substrate-binding protein
MIGRGSSMKFTGCIIVFVCWLLAGCKSYDEQEKERPDSPKRGTIRVSADESFKPIIDQMVMVYESNHPGTKINVDYKPEAECMKDLFNDSVRMIIATRDVSEEERDAMIDSLKIGPKSMVIARDGISVIVHPSEQDTLFTMHEIKQVLTGRYNKKLIPVFDGLKATSTVRFIIDSVLRGDSLTPTAMAARSSVSKTPGVIGFIGVSWIGNPEDTSQLSFLKKVKVVSLETTDRPDAYAKAYQANIYFKRYPMVRDLVYILKENYTGLGTGFANFMSGEIGQIIFNRAYLAPTQKKLGIRPVRLNE